MRSSPLLKVTAIILERLFGRLAVSGIWNRFLPSDPPRPFKFDRDDSDLRTRPARNGENASNWIQRPDDSRHVQTSY